MMPMTPLLSRPQPIENESFASYVERLCSFQPLQVSTSTMLHHVGLTEQETSRIFLFGYGLTLSLDHLTRFAHAVRLPEAVISGMLLSHYDGICLDTKQANALESDSIRRVAYHNWAYFAGSHFCPLCLGEDQAWRLRWKLPWTFLCQKHSCFLVGTCPSCEKRAGNFNQSVGMSPRYGLVVPEPGYCFNPPRFGIGKTGNKMPCGQNLMEVQADPVHSTRLLEAQTWIDRCLENYVVLDGMRTLTSVDVFDQLRSICSFILFVAEPQDLGDLPPSVLETFSNYAARREEIREQEKGTRGTSFHTYKSAPMDPRLMAAILPLSTEILRLPPDEAYHHALPILERSREVKSNNARSLLRYFNIEGMFKTVLERYLSHSSHFSFKLGRKSVQRETLSNFSPRVIPQMLWITEYTQNFKHFFDAYDVTESTGRKFCSMALIRLGHDCTWREAARYLELPLSTATGTANKMVGILYSEEATSSSFREALYELADRLSQDVYTIDYLQRRKLLGEFCAIPQEVWCSIEQPAHRRPEARRRSAAAWLWSELTLGDAYLSPALKSQKPGQQEALREVYRRFCVHWLPKYQENLWIYGKEFLTSKEDAALIEERARAAPFLDELQTPL